MIILLAVGAEGKCLVVWERKPEKLWEALPFESSHNQCVNQLPILRDRLEPMLKPEIEHRGLSTGSRGFVAKLIAWVEGIAPMDERILR